MPSIPRERGTQPLSPTVPGHHDRSSATRNSSGRRRPAVIPACDRCRSYRKKCSRTFPACSLCVSAGKACSYREPPSTPKTEAVQLRARVQWFSEYINCHLPSSCGTNIEDIETGSDLASLLKPSVTSVAIESQNKTASKFVTNSPQPTDARQTTDLNPCTDANALVTQAKILKNLEKLGHLARSLRDSQSTLFYLVLSTGCNAPEERTQIPCEMERRFEGAFAEIVQEFLCRTDIGAYALIGIAARQAITAGLTQRHSNNKTHSPTERELRHRLYWCIFTLDCMMAVFLGLPASLDSHDNVPYPSLTVDEFAGPERSVHAQRLQTSRHVIQLRQLESRILNQVHFIKAKEIAELTPLDRRTILKGLHASVDEWYSQGCLISPAGDDHVTVHSSTTWLNARYYFLLVLLYYPNHFNSSAGAISWQDMEQFAQLHLQATAALFHQHQLPLNCNTLYRLLPICLVLMYSFTELYRRADWASKSTFPFEGGDEVNVAVTVLEAYSSEWHIACRAAQILRQFHGIISGSIEAFFSEGSSFPVSGSDMPSLSGEDRNNTKENLVALVQPCILALTILMQDSMGESTCFQFIELPTNTGAHQAYDYTRTASQHHPGARQEQRQQPYPPQQQGQPFNSDQQAAGLGTDDTLNYFAGWADTELNFL